MRRTRRDRRVRYKKPWTRWFVNLLVALLLAAAALAALAYVPPYWRSWKARSAINEVASQTYSRRSRRDTWGNVLSDIRSQLRRRVTKIIGRDRAEESLQIKVSKDEDSKWIRIQVAWDDLAEFPLVHKKRVLHFSLSVKAATK